MLAITIVRQTPAPADTSIFSSLRRSGRKLEMADINPHPASTGRQAPLSMAKVLYSSKVLYLRALLTPCDFNQYPYCTPVIPRCKFYLYTVQPIGWRHDPAPCLDPNLGVGQFGQLIWRMWCSRILDGRQNRRNTKPDVLNAVLRYATLWVNAGASTSLGCLPCP
jgi:hypothetical protein